MSLQDGGNQSHTEEEWIRGGFGGLRMGGIAGIGGFGNIGGIGAIAHSSCINPIQHFNS